MSNGGNAPTPKNRPRSDFSSSATRTREIAKNVLATITALEIALGSEKADAIKTDNQVVNASNSLSVTDVSVLAVI